MNMEKYLQIQLDSALKRRVKMRCASTGETVKTLVTRLLTEWVEGKIVSDSPTMSERDFE